MIIKQNTVLFIKSQKQKQLSMKVILMIYLNQFILRLNQTYKNFLEEVRVGLFIQLKIIL